MKRSISRWVQTTLLWPSNWEWGTGVGPDNTAMAIKLGVGDRGRSRQHCYGHQTGSGGRVEGRGWGVGVRIGDDFYWIAKCTASLRLRKRCTDVEWWRTKTPVLDSGMFCLRFCENVITRHPFTGAWNLTCFWLNVRYTVNEHEILLFFFYIYIFLIYTFHHHLAPV